MERGSVRITLTDNRYTMISVRRLPPRGSRDRHYDVRLHIMFADADPVITRALAHYVADNDRDASRVLGDFIDANQGQVKGRARRTPTTIIVTSGDHHDLRAFVFRREETAGRGTDSHRIEVVGGNDFAGNLLGCVPPRGIARDAAIGGKACEGARVVTVVLVIRIGSAAQAAAAPCAPVVKSRDAFGLGHVQRAQEDSVDERKDRDVYRYAEGESGNGGQRESGRPAQQPDRVSNVLRELAAVSRHPLPVHDCIRIVQLRDQTAITSVIGGGGPGRSLPRAYRG
jgi:hypothetical protein